MAFEDPNQKKWANKKALLIDDFSGILTVMRNMLQHLGMENLDQATNGSEAMSLLEKNRYDLVICDYNLGEGKNGQQILEEVKQRELILPSAIWLIVSAEKGVEAVMGAAEHQPDGYVIKPITQTALLARLNRISEKKIIFREIDKAMEEKAYLTAISACNKCLAEPKNKLHAVDLLRLKAQLFLKIGEHDKAGIVFDRVMAERDFSWAKTGLAKVKLINNELEAAKILLEEVIKDNPNYLDAYDCLGDCLLRLEKTEEAKKLLAAATNLSPNSVLRQRNLGELAMKLGDFATAERAFRRGVLVGKYSYNKTPDSYLGLARLCGLKGDSAEAIKLLNTVKDEFNTNDIELRAKISETNVFNDCGELVMARRSGNELGKMLSESAFRPDLSACLDLARLLFTVGAKDSGSDLIREIIINNHDNPDQIKECQDIFDHQSMSVDGAEFIARATKEANEMMDKGMMLWRSGELAEAVSWMRACRPKLSTNSRFFLNNARLLIAYIEKNGSDRRLLDEAREVIAKADILSPDNKRSAAMMEKIAGFVSAGANPSERSAK